MNAWEEMIEWLMPTAAASQMVKGDLPHQIIHHTEEASTLTEVSCAQPSSWHLLSFYGPTQPKYK